MWKGSECHAMMGSMYIIQRRRITKSWQVTKVVSNKVVYDVISPHQLVVHSEYKFIISSIYLICIICIERYRWQQWRKMKVTRNIMPYQAHASIYLTLSNLAFLPKTKYEINMCHALFAISIQYANNAVDTTTNDLIFGIEETLFLRATF